MCRVVSCVHACPWRRKIRPCPSTNPGCVSTNPLGSSGSFASPLLIPESSAGDKAVQSLRQAIEKTQSNVDFKVDEDTPYGQYPHAVRIEARSSSFSAGSIRSGTHELSSSRGHAFQATTSRRRWTAAWAGT